MVEERVVNGMEVEMEFRLTEQTFPKKESCSVSASEGTGHFSENQKKYHLNAKYVKGR